MLLVIYNLHFHLQAERRPRVQPILPEALWRTLAHPNLRPWTSIQARALVPTWALLQTWALIQEAFQEIPISTHTRFAERRGISPFPSYHFFFILPNLMTREQAMESFFFQENNLRWYEVIIFTNPSDEYFFNNLCPLLKGLRSGRFRYGTRWTEWLLMKMHQNIFSSCK